MADAQELLDSNDDMINTKMVYETICCGDLQNFETVTEQWKDVLSNQKMLTLISRAYCELKLKYVPMSAEMELSIQSKLVNLCWPSINANKTCILDRSDIEARIHLLLSKISILLQNEIEENKFLYITEYVAKNMYVLKQSLKSTYGTIPWEEMLFCLVMFVVANKRISDLNVFYRAVLTKDSLLNHLRVFHKSLIELNLPSDGLNVALRSGRQKVVSGILSVKPEFSALYDDYSQVRDIQSLEKMKLYADAALVADFRTRQGQLTIKRCLQVLGEQLKDTLESPNLSAGVCELLLRSAPHETRQLLTATRNSLSHQHTLLASTAVYENLQNDIKKIAIVISRILYSRKMSKIKLTLSKIAHAYSKQEIQDGLRILEDVHALRKPEKLIIDQSTTEQLKIQDLMGKIDELVPEKTEYETDLHKQINKIIFESKEVDDILNHYNIGLRMLKGFCDFYGQEIETNKGLYNDIPMRLAALDILTKLSPEESENISKFHSLKRMTVLLMGFYESIKPRLPKDSSFIFNSIMKIHHVFAYEKNSIRWIDEFKEQLGTHKPKRRNPEEKITRTKNIKKIRPTNVIIPASIDKEDPIHQKLRELKDVYYPSGKKLDYFTLRFDQKIMIETLLLDILSDMDTAKCLVGNVLFIESDAALLTGKCLRNYLAHGNDVVDAFVCDPFISVFLMGRNISENTISYDTKFGAIYFNCEKELNAKFERDLRIIDEYNFLRIILLEGKEEEFKKFLLQGKDELYRNSDLQTMLHLAAQGGCLEIVKLLKLNKNLDIRARDKYGRTALHVAATHGRTDIIKFLVKEANFPIDQTNNYDQTALFISAQNGWAQSVEELIHLGADSNCADDFCMQPLHCAVKNNHLDVVKVLLDCGNVGIDDYTGSLGFTSLHFAAEDGHENIVEFLLDNNANIHTRSLEGETALHIAVSRNHLNIVKSLVKKGANVNARAFATGYTPLHKIDYREDESLDEIVTILLKNGASVNDNQTKYKHTPLHTAATKGHIKIIEILLEYGADIDAFKYNMMTPLMCAAMKGQLKAVHLLCEKGANINITGENGKTALHISAVEGHNDILSSLIDLGANLEAECYQLVRPLHIAAQFGYLDIVNTLLNRGASVDSAICDGSTALHFSTYENFEEITEVLIMNGANVNAEKQKKCTPFNKAAENNCSLKILKLLLNNGAYIDGVDESESTALHKACAHGNTDVVQFLIEENADVNRKNVFGATPVLNAAENNHLCIAKILIENGADLNVGDIDGKSPLWHAATYNFSDLAELLLSKGAEVNGSTGGIRPIVQAVLSGHRKITELLLKKKNIQLEAIENGPSLLHLAARNGNWHIGKLLIKHDVEIDALDDAGRTPLGIAVSQNHREFVDVLLEEGADVATKNQDLLVHAVLSGYSEIVESLLKAGAINMRHKDKLNRSTLELAVSEGFFEIVKMFFKYKEIDVNEKDESGNTILHIASHQGYINIAEWLTENRASVDERNIGGLKAIHLAINQGHIKLVKWFIEHETYKAEDTDVNGVTILHYSAHVGQANIALFLINCGAKVNAVNSNLLTPLHLAAKQGHIEVANILLNNAAVYNAVDASGLKPNDFAQHQNILKLFKSLDELFEAVELNDTLAVEKLIQEGVPIDAKRSDSKTLLHIAAKSGYVQMCDILLKNKANPNSLGPENDTSLHLAAKYSHTLVLMSLLVNGATYNAVDDSGKTPANHAELKEIINLLHFIETSFDKVQNSDISVVDDIKKIETTDTIKAVLRATNKEGKTLVVLAIHTKFPQVESLLGMLQDIYEISMETVSVLVHNEKFTKALAILRNILNERVEILGEDNPGTLDIKFEMAVILFDQSQYSEALDLYKEVYEVRKKVLGVDHEDTLRVRNSVALVLTKQMNFKEAVEILKEVYAKQEGILNEDTLYTRFYLATALAGLGKHAEALSMNEETYLLCLQVLKPDASLTSSVLGNNAAILTSMGNHLEAYRIFQEVFRNKERIFGPTHSQTLKASYNMAMALIGLDKLEESLQILMKVLACQTISLGPDHADTLQTTVKISSVLYLQQKKCEAKEHLQGSYDKIVEVLGDNHPDTLRSKDLLSFTRDSNLQNSDIIEATKNNDIDAVRTSIKNGCCVNIKDGKGQCALHIAVGFCNVEIIKILLEEFADCTVKDTAGNTPLHVASLQGNFEAVSLLITHCKKRMRPNRFSHFINAVNFIGGFTTLHFASKIGWFEIVKFLLKNGARFDVADKLKYKKPIEYSGSDEIRELLELVDTIFKCAETGDAAILKSLMKLRKDELEALLNAKNEKQLTALEIAISKGFESFSNALYKLKQNQ